MSTQQGPLAGLRVLDFGHYIAGPLAGVFLADQGADVVHVRSPHAGSWDVNTEAALARGKRILHADLKEEGDRQRILALAAECDVILENFRPGVMERLGLGYETVAALNSGVIYVSMPGYSRHDPRAAQPAWDATISAACGLFTDLSIGGAALGLPPTFTPLPLPSVYAGLWSAIGTLAALFARQSHGHGERIEVPLLDAAMSAAAGVIFQVDRQPARYNAPPMARKWLDRISLQRLPAGATSRMHGLFNKMMPPLFRNYVCTDGRQLFLCAIDNAGHVSKLLDTTGLREEAGRLGFVFGDVLDVPPSRNNINAFRGASVRWLALERLLAKRFASAPADEWVERLAKAGVPASRQRKLEEWLSMPVMHESGVLIHRRNSGGQPMVQPAPQVDITGVRTSTQAAVATSVDSGAVTGWASDRGFPVPTQIAFDGVRPPPLAGVRVLDLANVIAGPAAGRTLAELGAEVTHVSAVSPRMGPRMTLLLGMEVNQGKRSLALDLRHPLGQGALRRLLPATDIVLYNKLPTQAAWLGVAPEQVHAVNENAVVCAVTAYSGTQPGGWEDRPAYDPVIQALSGIMQRFGGETTPAVHGIASCIDYFTGYAAAFGAVLGLVARSRGDRRLVVRTSLARTAGWVQLPQVCNAGQPTPSGLAALGEIGLNRVYRARDGWLHVAAGPRKMSAEVPAEPFLAQAWLTHEIGRRRLAQAVDWARGHGLIAQAVLSARHLRKQAVEAASCYPSQSAKLTSGRILRVKHPAGDTYFVPESGWLRFSHATRPRIACAPAPGQNSVEILRQAGFKPQEIALLLDEEAAATRWSALQRYLPV